MVISEDEMIFGEDVMKNFLLYRPSRDQEITLSGMVLLWVSTSDLKKKKIDEDTLKRRLV